MRRRSLITKKGFISNRISSLFQQVSPSTITITRTMFTDKTNIFTVLFTVANIVEMMVMALKHVLITKEGITRWFHKLRKNLFIKISIYFPLLVHRQEYRNDINNK
jgi:hypothetical protein